MFAVTVGVECPMVFWTYRKSALKARARLAYVWRSSWIVKAARFVFFKARAQWVWRREVDPGSRR